MAVGYCQETERTYLASFHTEHSFSNEKCLGNSDVL